MTTTAASAMAPSEESQGKATETAEGLKQSSTPSGADAAQNVTKLATKGDTAVNAKSNPASTALASAPVEPAKPAIVLAESVQVFDLWLETSVVPWLEKSRVIGGVVEEQVGDFISAIRLTADTRLV